MSEPSAPIDAPEPVAIDAPEPVPPGAPGAPSAPEPTGDHRVDAAVARLADLDTLPVQAHPAVFERVHRTLDDALAHPDEE